MTLRIAWLTTGRGPGSFGALEYALDAIDGGLPVDLATLFVNREPGESPATDALLRMAAERGVHVETLSSVRFRKVRGGKISKPGEPLAPWRLEYDAAVADRLARHQFDLGVMFGYMLVASPPLYSRFPLINDHPALPDGPIGTYQEVVAELIRARARESGCMMNVVTGDLDRGPAISYCRYTIRDAENEALWREAKSLLSDTKLLEESSLYADIRARGVRRERPFVVETLRSLCEGTLAVPPSGAATDLSSAVEAVLHGGSGVSQQ
ncbi:MAG: formyltransferase family protein [Tepidiformaceae bacterium]